jgi:hypothetical protein
MTPNRYALLIALTVIAGVGSLMSRTTGGSLDQAGLYFAHDASAFQKLLGPLGPNLVASLNWDFVFLGGYGLLFLALGWFQHAQGRWGTITLVVGGLGAVLDVLENQTLLQLTTASTIDANTLRTMQIFCVTKFLCSAVAISSASMFFTGSDIWKRVLRVILRLGSVGLAVGCAIFVLERVLQMNWGQLAGLVVQAGLLIASLGLVMTILEYIREWRDARLRPF